jgi:uncharacterized protein (DUF2132 family)
MYNYPKDLWEGVTLQHIVEYLVKIYGFEELGQIIKIKCFVMNPSIKSSLVFLRKTPWARSKVEELYADTIMLEKQEEMRKLDKEKMG